MCDRNAVPGERNYADNLQAQLKMAASEAQTAGPGISGKGVGVGSGSPINTMGAEPSRMLDRLRSIRNGMGAEQERIRRAIFILERHSEFEDLLWLIRSGIV